MRLVTRKWERPGGRVGGRGSGSGGVRRREGAGLRFAGSGSDGRGALSPLTPTVCGHRARGPPAVRPALGRPLWYLGESRRTQGVTAFTNEAAAYEK